MNILEYDDCGASIRLDQRELLLVMALVQEGRESFGCKTQTGHALDAFFSSANVMVEEARRQSLQKAMVRQRIRTVATPQPALKKDGSHG